MRSGLWLLAVVAACRFGFDKRAPGTDPTGDGGTDGDVFVPAEFEPYWTSSARYRARLLVPVEGGDPYWIGWRDQMLGMDCLNAVAADGVERCVHQDQSATRFFSDAGCTQPLGWVRPQTCGTPGYLFSFDVSGRYHIYQVGPEYSGPRYDKEGCAMTNGPTSGVLVQLGAEIPATMMLDAKYSTVPVGDYQRRMQGLSDGAQVEVGVIDTPSGPCRPLANKLGPSRCASTQFRATLVYLDNNCSQPAYHWKRESYDPQQISQFAVFDATACDESYRMFSVVTDVTAPTHYRAGPGGACNAISTDVLDRLYTATEIADPMPMGTLVIGPRRGRLGYLYWVGPDGKAIATRYWDHDLGTPCMPINGTDGKLRCIPTQGRIIDAVPDTTCTAPSQSLVAACYGNTAPVQGTTYTSCVDNWPVRSLPQISTAASVYTDTCSAISQTFYNPLQPGAQIPPTMFAEMMEIVE